MLNNVKNEHKFLEHLSNIKGTKLHVLMFGSLILFILSVCLFNVPVPQSLSIIKETSICNNWSLPPKTKTNQNGE